MSLRSSLTADFDKSVFTEISSDTEMIYSGMYLEGTISSNITNNVCKIPRRSIFSENNIYVVNSENKLEIMSVEIISYQGSNVLVSGINNNTMVVNEPLIDVTEGIIVKPISK